MFPCTKQSHCYELLAFFHCHMQCYFTCIGVLMQSLFSCAARFKQQVINNPMLVMTQLLTRQTQPMCLAAKRVSFSDKWPLSLCLQWMDIHMFLLISQIWIYVLCICALIQVCNVRNRSHLLAARHRVLWIVKEYILYIPQHLVEDGLAVLRQMRSFHHKGDLTEW